MNPQEEEAEARVMDSPAAHDAQVSNETAPEKSHVVDFRSREQWSTAFRAAALAVDYTKTEILLAWSLAQNFHCKNRICAPDGGYPALAAQINAGESTVKRAAKRLEADGWCIRHRGGRYDTVKFTLTIPPSISLDIAALMEEPKPASISLDFSLHKSQYGETLHKTEVEQRRAGGPPARPCSVPVESLVVEPATMRAPEGAQANPVDREEPEMLTPEQKDAVAELLQYKWTPRELADASGCPDGVPIMQWLAQNGLAERAGNGWKFRKNLN
jgi:hypothetical protein